MNSKLRVGAIVAGSVLSVGERLASSRRGVLDSEHAGKVFQIMATYDSDL